MRPDLSAWSKAIANGYPLAAVTGAEWLRKAASQVFVTGSFWCGAAAMAAALATLKVARRDGVVERMNQMGRRLREGLDERATEAGLKLRQTGPAQMPMVLFENDPDFRIGFAFCSAALRERAYFHPKHNMFLCAAHGESEIEQALQAARIAFAAVAEMREPV